MTDPIQQAIDKTLGTTKVADPYAALLEARNLLEAARDQRNSDKSRMAKLAEDFLKADAARINANADTEMARAQFVSEQNKCRALKDQIKRMSDMTIARTRLAIVMCVVSFVVGAGSAGLFVIFQ